MRLYGLVYLAFQFCKAVYHSAHNIDVQLRVFGVVSVALFKIPWRNAIFLEDVGVPGLGLDGFLSLGISIRQGVFRQF